MWQLPPPVEALTVLPTAQVQLDSLPATTGPRLSTIMTKRGTSTPLMAARPPSVRASPNSSGQ